MKWEIGCSLVKIDLFMFIHYSEFLKLHHKKISFSLSTVECQNTGLISPKIEFMS